jgi:N,N-dimethylformamidase
MRDPETGRMNEQELGKKQITGYPESWSVRRGDSIEFMVNCDGPETYRADVVRMVCSDTHPDGPGYDERVIKTPLGGTHTGRTQEIHPGSHVTVPDDSRLNLTGDFTLQTFVYPTLPERGTDGLLTKWNDEEQTGYALVIDDEGTLTLWLGDGTTVRRVRATESVPESTWTLVSASFDADVGEVQLMQRPLSDTEHQVADPDTTATNVDTQSVETPAVAPTDAAFVLAGYTTGRTTGAPVAGHFNGKLDQPKLFDRVLNRSEIRQVAEAMVGSTTEGIVAAWDFAAGVDSDGFPQPERVVDAGPNQLHGRAVQLPTRGVPGYNWDGSEVDYTKAPDQYGAIHFHYDDVVDAKWDTSLSWDVPPDQDSGAYAVRLRTEEDESYIPFYVRPEVGGSTANIAFLAPTNTYLAYGNHHMWIDNASSGFPLVDDCYAVLSRNREYGLSLYDTHADGHGCMYASRLRPMPNMEPKAIRGGGAPSHLGGYNADLYLVDWLETKNYQYDVITDEDLHKEGERLLSQYNVVLTGGHAEYYTEAQLDAIDAYQRDGGRFINLSGNGFYWVIAYHPENPQIIETRRGETGTQPWIPEPGEGRHAFTGEQGGLWRRRGRPPQQLTGVGFSAQWETNGTCYRRQPDSYRDEVSFVFDGVDSEKIGDFGFITGGAAGQEVDRYDTDLGTPEHAYLLASSEGHTADQLRVVEELSSTSAYPSSRMDPAARADIVYYRVPNGGAVFSTGSMTWIGSLASNDYENNVSRITENVLDKFSSDEPLPGEDPSR